MSGPWLISDRPDPSARCRLFCFPYAGGSAAAYQRWHHLAPRGLQVCAVELPGHGTRARESAVEDFDTLLERLADAIAPALEGPFAFFGHSMGGLIAYELARLLGRRGVPGPRHVFVSASATPDTLHRLGSPRHASDAEMRARLAGLGGTPRWLLDEPESMALMMPAVRADCAALEAYRYRPADLPGTPLTAFAGRSDTVVPADEVRGWRHFTTGAFRFRLVDGDHFYLGDAAGHLLDAVAGTVDAAGTPRPRAAPVPGGGGSPGIGARPVALVTGGTRGIGRAVCLRLAADGHDVALCYASDSGAARALEKEIGELGRAVYARRADVSDPVAVRTLVAGVQDALGPVTALVTSAGILRDTQLALMEGDQWQDVLGVHLDGVFHVCRAVVEEMMRLRRGAVVNLSSVAGLLGHAGQTNYAAAKAGVIGFTKSLAQEVGRYGIRVNAVAPGYIGTDPVRQLPQDMRERAVERVALRRLGEPEEVADLVSFLLSDRASYITGSVIRIDGGFL